MFENPRGAMAPLPPLPTPMRDMLLYIVYTAICTL